MPLQRFDFPFHVAEIQYPQSSTAVTFGKGYEFVSKPNAPDQIRFMLHFETMKFYKNASNVAIATTDPQINALALMNFYEAHRLYEKFEYIHPIKGLVVVRFGKPLALKPKAGGGGSVEAFVIELVLQP